MDSISEIKQKIDIVSLVGGYVQLKKSGRNYRGLCPFHSEKTPSFMVSPELQIYKCFGCGESGDQFKFVEKIEGVDFTTALAQLAEKAGVKLEKSDYHDKTAEIKKRLLYINSLTAKFYHELMLRHPMGKAGLEYFKTKRKLTPQTINEYMLGFAPDSSNILQNTLKKRDVTQDEMLQAGLVVKRENSMIADKFFGRVIFPITGIDGKILGFTGRTVFNKEPKYLNTPETLVYQKSTIIYGLDKARLYIKKDGAVFVEGQMDVISAHQAGFKNVIAVSGTSLTDTQLNILSRYTNDVTFCFDSDTAGSAAIARGIDMAEAKGFDLRVAVIPDGFKDLDELVQSNKSKAEEMFKNAVPVYDFFLYSAMKRFNKASPDGKKKIMDEVGFRFAKITNPVLKDHYSKLIAKELDISEDTIASILRKDFGSKSSYELSVKEKIAETPFAPTKSNHEKYIISLLLKANLDIIVDTGYKLSPSEFFDEKIGLIYKALIEYARAHKIFDPRKFEKKLSAEEKAIFSDLFLWEEADISDDHLPKEIAIIANRLLKDSAKRKLKSLTEQIKNAEKSGDTQNLIKLTKEFEKISKALL